MSANKLSIVEAIVLSGTSSLHEAQAALFESPTVQYVVVAFDRLKPQRYFRLTRADFLKRITKALSNSSVSSVGTLITRADTKSQTAKDLARASEGDVMLGVANKVMGVASRRTEGTSTIRPRGKTGRRGTSRDPASGQSLHLSLRGEGRSKPPKTRAKPPLPEASSESSPIETELYPRLDLPARAKKDRKFTLTIGLRGDQDLTLGGGEKLNLPEDVRPDEKCLIVLVPNGLSLDTLTLEVPLEVTSREIAGQMAEEVMTAELTANYYLRGCLIGMARRTILAVDSPAPVLPVPKDAGSLGSPTAELHADMTVQVEVTGSGLLWTWNIPSLELTGQSSEPTLPNQTGFALSVTRDLNDCDYFGLVASKALESKGRALGAAMPGKLVADLQQLAKKKKTPSLLFISNENEIPWELAILDPLPDPALGTQFLGAQVQMGRWILSGRTLMPPAQTVPVRQIFAMAGEYKVESNEEELPHAIDERAFLVDNYKAKKLKATLKDLEKILTVDRKANLVHFAVHGISNPEADNHRLILNDGRRIPASSFGMAYKPGDEPTYSVVFLNACQVGVPGVSLGQTSGFPGEMLNSGVQGFIAPLWNVDDEIALEIARKFYKLTMPLAIDEPVGQAVTLGDALRQIRLMYDQKGDMTCMAYVYYGHPNLKLERS